MSDLVTSSVGPVSPSVGLGVLHLFCKPTPLADAESIVSAVKAAESAGCQIVTVALLGHKADIAVMATHGDMRQLRTLQTDLQHAGLDVVDSYVSITELSEYAKDVPDSQKQVRLYPEIPPRNTAVPMTAWCFYPMSKKRDAHANWFVLPFESRRDFMYDHGKSGRKFAGRIVQYITGSTGLDDFEWGVTLFGAHTDDIKDVVYTMRFDHASAVYADFGQFYFGMVTPVEDLVAIV